MIIKIKKIHHNAKVPVYSTDGAGCFDLYAATHNQSIYGTGLCFEVPDGYIMLVFSRSSTGFKYSAQLCNSVGVIDSDYRGEVLVKFDCDVPYKVGDRIAQAMIMPYSRCSFQFADTLKESERGNGGFGSTGNK